MKSNHKYAASLAAAALVVALGVGLSLWAFKQIEESGAARSHVFTVLSNADELLFALVDADTNHLGYLFSGDETYLKPYSAARDSIYVQMEKLRQQSEINAAREHLNVLAPLIEAKMTALSRNVELRRKHNMIGALANLRGSQGKPLMDSIRAEMRGFMNVEERALAQHDYDFRSNMRSMLMRIMIASLIVLLLAFLLIYLIYRETQQRLKNIANLETERMLKVQQETNIQLERANATLQVSEEKFAVTLNSIGDAVMATDAEGRVTLLNPSAQKFTGWTQAEAAGRHVTEIFHIINKGTRQPSIMPVLETTNQGTVQGMADNTVLIARDGRERDIADSSAPIRHRDGQVAGTVLVFRDVTDRVEIERGLAKAHEELKALTTELKRTARAKSEFLANMSHELRTPLNSINGFSEVLIDETFGPLNEKQKRYVNNVLISGRHLLLLINQILDMAKIESGKMTLALSGLPMKRLLQEISLLVADMVSKKKLTMVLEIAEDLPDIEADDLKVKEIIYNLISNAVKFTPEGGQIGMRAKKSGAEIEVVVWDTGVGIARENREKIFEGFFRVDTPYSRVTEGTGLGLPLSRKLVELHGGKISVESEGPDKGTSVRVTLPIRSTKAVCDEKEGIGCR